MSLDIINILFSILGFQLIFVAGFLFQSSKGKRISNRLLGLIFLLLAISVFDILITVTGLVSTPEISLLADNFILAYGPLILYFTQSVLYKDFQFKQINLAHIIPFALLVLYTVWFISRMTPADQLEIERQLNVATFNWQQRLIEFGLLAHIIIYMVFSKLKVASVKKSSLETQSSIQEDNFKWLNFILNSFILFFVTAIIHFFLPLFGVKNGLSISLLAMIAFIFYFVNQVLLKMLNQTTNQSGIIGMEELNRKYEGSNLGQAEHDSIRTRLETLMQETRPYLESDLSIDELASQISCTPKHLSQVINEVYQSNFFDFINRHRIEEAKSKMKNSTDEKLTILEVLYASGFNSKSSFNTAFKKFTNQTPTEYKNSL